MENNDEIWVTVFTIWYFCDDDGIGRPVYFKTKMTDLYMVGIYGSGYKLGMLMMLIVMGFNMAWQPFYLKMGKQDENKPLYSRINTYVFTFFRIYMDHAKSMGS